ncbi:hypothetical protein INR49_030212 [Caranx melampygus]|nr:hypothetical protein INR49_030212 [Caranx melampygus]
MTGVNSDEVGWLLPSVLAPPNWTEGMDKEQVINMLTLFQYHPITTDLILQEYTGTSEDREKIRNGFTELLGDLMFTIPAIKVASAHRDAGATVYLYEYHHAPSMLQAKRPSFVGCDHGDEIFTVLGFCFTTGHVRLLDVCPEEEEVFSKTVMSYWGNFARTGSPNGDGLVHWPKYGTEEEYLLIDLKEQVVHHRLKKNRFDYHTKILPQKIQEQKEKWSAASCRKVSSIA